MTARPSLHRVALVTGASQGLGLALTRELVSRGWAVAMAARRMERLQSAAGRIRQDHPGAELLVYRADVSVESDRAGMIAAIARRWDRLDLLVNNASTLGPTPLLPLIEVPPGAFETVFTTNVAAPVRLVQVALPLLEAADRALVINVTSDAALVGYPRWGVYGASKAALELVTRTFEQEFAGRTPRFLAVDPGEMNTAMHRAAVPGADPSTLADPSEIAARLAGLVEASLGADRPGPGDAVQGRIALQG